MRNAILLTIIGIALSQHVIARDLVTYYDCVNPNGSMSYRIFPCDKDQYEFRKFNVDLDKIGSLQSRKESVGPTTSTSSVLPSKGSTTSNKTETTHDKSMAGFPESMREILSAATDSGGDVSTVASAVCGLWRSYPQPEQRQELLSAARALAVNYTSGKLIMDAALGGVCPPSRY